MRRHDSANTPNRAAVQVTIAAALVATTLWDGALEAETRGGPVASQNERPNRGLELPPLEGPIHPPGSEDPGNCASYDCGVPPISPETHPGYTGPGCMSLHPEDCGEFGPPPLYCGGPVGPDPGSCAGLFGGACGAPGKNIPVGDPGSGSQQPDPTYHQASSPASPNPVSLAYGDKYLTTRDLSVSLIGADFVLSRSYTSDPAFAGGASDRPGLCGANWSMNVFHFMEEDGNDLIFSTPAGGSNRLIFDSAPTPDEWRSTGSTNQWVEEAELTVEGTSYQVYRLIEPGHWEWDFLKSLNGGGTLDTDIVGLPIQARDRYGNTRTFEYDEVDGSTWRLTKIYLNGTTSANAAATVEFSWYGTAGGTAYEDRLEKVEVKRGSTVTQRAEYTYFGGSSYHGHVGTDGDLIQVATFVAIDHAPGAEPSGGPTDEKLWQISVTQYRYHDGTSETTDSDSDGYIETGEVHQLKAVILPQQIEYAAQQSAGTGPESIIAFAETLTDSTTGSDSTTVYGSTTIIDLASKIIEEYEDSGEHRVLRQHLLTSCGCSGPDGPGILLEYQYLEPTTADEYARTTKVTESTSSGGGTFRTRYYDLEEFTAGSSDVYYIGNQVVTDGTDYWVYHVEYDSATRRTEQIYLPSVMSSYTPATASVDASYTASASSGLVYEFDYTTFASTADHRLTKSSVRKGTGGTLETIVELEYGDSANTNEREYLLKKMTRYRVAGSAAAADQEVTEYSYLFHTTGGGDVAWVETKIEAETQGENGQKDSTGPHYYYAHQYFDTTGQNTWNRGWDDALTAYEYDDDTGAVTEEETNSAPPSPTWAVTPPSGSSFTGRNADGGSLTWTYTHDELGRVRSTESPVGVVTRYVREMRELGTRPGIAYFVQTTLPHDLSSTEFAGPAVVSWLDAAGEVIAQKGYEMTVDANSPYGETELFGSTYDYDIDDDAELSRTTVSQALSGLVESVVEWHSIAEDGEGGGKYTTSYEYDNRGNLEKLTAANGTVYEYVYDVQDRLIEEHVGSTTGTQPNTVLVAAYEYDDGGAGDGLLTEVRRPVDATSANDRYTTYLYDYRNRLVRVSNPLAPHQYVEYDNLDRITKTAVFDAVPTGIDVPGERSSRGAYSETAYSQRGLVYRTRVAIDPTDASPEFLETHMWYDESGRAVGAWGPNAAAVKTTYDGLGRVITAYVTDRRDDDDPGTADNYLDVYNTTTQAADVAGDVILEERHQRYISDSGLPDLATTHRRTHDAADTKTGALSAFTGGDAELEITTYQGLYYDDAARLIRSADYGTNLTEFKHSGTAPTINQASPPAVTTTTAIISAYTYNSRGLIDTTVTPIDGSTSQTTLLVYDDLGRTIATIANQSLIDGDDLDWDTADERWTVTAVMSDDADRVTSVVYDGVGNTIKEIAHLPDGTGEEVQVTEYVYDAQNDTGSEDSRIYSHDLLTKIIYPDEESGEAEEDYSEEMAYNRQGEVRYSRDQNGTKHAYTLDKLGRTTFDEVTTVGSGVDATIDGIEVAYDDLGRPSRVTSYTEYSKSETVANEVKYTYTPLWQIATVAQEHDGEVDGSSLEVEYTYSDKDVDLGNYSRLTTQTYPDGSDVDYTYGASGSVDDIISRTAKLGPTGHLTEYSYFGMGGVVQVDFITPDVQLDRSASHTGERQTQGNTDNPGVYPGLDKFGRIVRHMWVDGDFTEYGAGWTGPNKPSIVEREHSYDLASNRLEDLDGREKANFNTRDGEFSYDDLFRLIEAKRGTQGGSFTHNGGSQKWDLDVLGNHLSTWTDLANFGTYDSDEEDERVHTENELDERTLKEQASGSSDLVLDLTHDKNGNIKSAERPDGAGSSTTISFTHDAWNRLVKVKYGASTRAEYQYNGANWRITSTADTDGNGSLDERRFALYNDGWQLLEERIDGETPFQAAPDSDTDRHLQYVWGVRYIDDILVHREDDDADGGYEYHWYHLTDVQYSNVALLNHTARIEERVRYDAYGKAYHSWGADVNGDRVVNINDTNDVNSGAHYGKGIHESGYEAELDLNRSGYVDVVDLIQVNSSYETALAEGVLSADDYGNTIGFSSYVYNVHTELYLVRFRCYDTALGRWIERDPLGYIDGMNVYEYVRGQPLTAVDPYGLVGWFGLKLWLDRFWRGDDPTFGPIHEWIAEHFWLRHPDDWLLSPGATIEAWAIAVVGGFIGGHALVLFWEAFAHWVVREYGKTTIRHYGQFVAEFILKHGRWPTAFEKGTKLLGPGWRAEGLRGILTFRWITNIGSLPTFFGWPGAAVTIGGASYLFYLVYQYIKLQYQNVKSKPKGAGRRPSKCPPSWPRGPIGTGERPGGPRMGLQP